LTHEEFEAGIHESKAGFLNMASMLVAEFTNVSGSFLKIDPIWKMSHVYCALLVLPKNNKTKIISSDNTFLHSQPPPPRVTNTLIFVDKDVCMYF